MAALEPEFKQFIVELFGEESKMEGWLCKEGVLLADDFGLLVTEEKEVDIKILPAAKAGGVATEGLMDGVRIKKQWKVCRKEEKGIGGLADAAESEVGLDEKVRKSCEGTWFKKHGFILAAGRMLVSTQLGPMHAMPHAAHKYVLFIH